MDTTNYCDRCGAAAKARYILENGDLVFCGHHARKYDEALVEQDALFDIDYLTDSPELAAV